MKLAVEPKNDATKTGCYRLSPAGSPATTSKIDQPFSCCNFVIRALCTKKQCDMARLLTLWYLTIICGKATLFASSCSRLIAPQIMSYIVCPTTCGTDLVVATSSATVNLNE